MKSNQNDVVFESEDLEIYACTKKDGSINIVHFESSSVIVLSNHVDMLKLADQLTIQAIKNIKATNEKK